MSDLEFAHIEWFWALLIVPAAIAWYWYSYSKNRASISMPTLGQLQNAPKSFKATAYHGLFVLKILAIAFVVMALARPQSSSSWQDITTEGIDIVLAIDISGSMLAQDLKPNRIEASKRVAMDFIDSRPNDRMGLVIYAGESFTQCPLTTDHDVLKNLFFDIKNGMIDDGTAIGMGLATSINRLKDSEAKSKVVILITDGTNNRGAVPPLTAAEIAKTFGVRVYTIGVGTKGKAPYPYTDGFGRKQVVMQDVTIDEETLKEIAKTTGGVYFRATDNDKLQTIYEDIDKLEKSKIEVTEFRKKSEEFFPFLAAAFALLALEYLLRNTYFRSLV